MYSKSYLLVYKANIYAIMKEYICSTALYNIQTWYKRRWQATMTVVLFAWVSIGKWDFVLLKVDVLWDKKIPVELSVVWKI